MNRTLKAIAALMLMIVVLFAVGCKKDNAAGDGVISGHTYVDLGLPSGTLWAACNVGANSPEEYGDYFAWGETQPKDRYNWNTYQYCMGSHNSLTKYCQDSSYGNDGFTDNLTVLQQGDDAASANWGEAWHTPTNENWQELMNNTAHIWTAQNGVYGRLFTATNGASLFLPAAGAHIENHDDGVGSFGCYWSSLLDTNCPYGAWEFCFSSDIFYLNYNTWRSDGQSVRPVCLR